MADSGHRDADRLEEMGCGGALALGDSKGEHNGGGQGDCDRSGAQSYSVAEESRTAPRASRVEQTLPRNLAKTESRETRETSHQDQGECRDGESPQENTKQAFQLEFDCKTRESRNLPIKFARKLDGSTAGDVHERERCEDVDENRFPRFCIVSLHDEFETSVSLASLNFLVFCAMSFVIAAREEPHMF